ncbi:MAG: substrate-binding domain-containing protein [Ruminococcus sp.]|nr:substrate-binding domain-containing protein [Ruminococcus sp.]
MNKTKRKGIFNRLAVCAVSLTTLASATACGKPANVGGKVAVICKNENVSFWDEVKTGATDCCDEMGYELLYYCASSDTDFASQVEYINDAIDKGAKAIVIAPNDMNELNDALKKANDQGIKVVNINSRCNFEDVVSYVGSSDFDGGAVAARNAASIFFDGMSETEENIGKIAMIGHTASTADLRLTGFRATFSPLLGQFVGQQQAAKAAAAAAQAQKAAAQAQAAQQQAEQAQAAAEGGANSAVTEAAQAAASQAASSGAPEEAVLNASLGAARSAGAPLGATEEEIQAAAQAATAKAIAERDGGSTEAPTDNSETAQTGETPYPNIVAAAQSAAKRASEGGAPEDSIRSAVTGAAQSAADGSGATQDEINAIIEEAVQAVLPKEEDQQSGAPSEDEKADMIAQFFIEGERCGTQEAAYEEAKRLLTENSDIRIMYTTNTNTTLGACQAIEEMDLADQVIVVGFNSDEQELKYIKSGILDGTIIQNPYNIGYIGTRYAIQAATGSSVTGSLDTGVTWISAKNINDDDVQLLLYPERT